ncbi:MAG: acyl carrier protein [Oscillospiraceae bacterium]|nr:acyl carrier protein [Oscillospiraceae bacterium]
MNIEEKIMQMVAERFNKSVEDLDCDTEFVSDLSADSLDQVELTIDIEDEFELPEVSEEDLTKIVTIGDLVDYVQDHVEG